MEAPILPAQPPAPGISLRSSKSEGIPAPASAASIKFVDVVLPLALEAAPEAIEEDAADSWEEFDYEEEEELDLEDDGVWNAAIDYEEQFLSLQSHNQRKARNNYQS